MLSSALACRGRKFYLQLSGPVRGLLRAAATRNARGL